MVAVLAYLAAMMVPAGWFPAGWSWLDGPGRPPCPADGLRRGRTHPRPSVTAGFPRQRKPGQDHDEGDDRHAEADPYGYHHEAHPVIALRRPPFDCLEHAKHPHPHPAFPRDRKS